MKKLILILVLSSYSCSLFCQGDFAPIGAKWYYVTGIDFSVEELIFSTAEKDTLLQNQLCRMITTEYYGADEEFRRKDSLYVFEKNDIVFYFNPHYNDFVLLYDFTLETGDTIFFPVPIPEFGIDSFSVVIDKVEIIEENGIALKYFYTKESSLDYFPTTFVENIGNLFSLFLPQGCCTVPGAFLKMVCYEDEKLGKIQLSDGFFCYDSVIDSVDDLKELSAKISISPNPTTGQLHIELDFEKSLSNPISYELFNLNGMVVYKGQSDNTEWNLDLSFLNKGLYLLRIRDLKEGSIYKKIVVQ